jgi:ketosteroid isomerase-like protein
MLQENVEVVKAAHPPSGTDIRSLFADDLDVPDRVEAAAPLFHPEFEWEAHGAAAERLAGKGLPALVDAWREWLEPFDSFRTEVEEFVQVEDGRVLVVLRDHCRPRGGDHEIESLGCSLWAVRDGKIARIDYYPTRAEGFEAAGLSE